MVTQLNSTRSIDLTPVCQDIFSSPFYPALAEGSSFYPTEDSNPALKCGRSQILNNLVIQFLNNPFNFPLWREKEVR